MFRNLDKKNFNFRKIIPDDSNLDEGKKRSMYEQIAEHCKRLGNFASASNYYIKLGDKVNNISLNIK